MAKIKYSEDDEFTQWLNIRLDQTATPKHKLISRQLCLEKGPTLTFHTAGQPFVWEISIQSAVKDKELMSELDPSDAKLIQWIFDNDFDVQNYNYEKSGFTQP